MHVRNISFYSTAAVALVWVNKVATSSGVVVVAQTLAECIFKRNFLTFSGAFLMDILVKYPPDLQNFPYKYQ